MLFFILTLSYYGYTLKVYAAGSFETWYPSTKLHITTIKITVILKVAAMRTQNRTLDKHLKQLRYVEDTLSYTTRCLGKCTEC